MSSSGPVSASDASQPPNDFEALLARALALPVAEREALIHELIQSLDGDLADGAQRSARGWQEDLIRERAADSDDVLESAGDALADAEGREG